MKTSNTRDGGKPISRPNPKRPVQNKDDLDSRESEENEFKGEDITHNKKEKKSEGKK